MLNYVDAHAPYVPQANRTAFSSGQPRDPLDPEQELWPLLYDRCLLDLDGHVGDLLDGLEARGRLENTAVVITSDHGEALGEHDHWSHGRSLYEELIRVPLYVAPPGGRGKPSDDTPLSGVAMPYLATRLLGLDAWPAPEERAVATEWHPRRLADGTAPRDSINGRDVAIDALAWIEGDRKLIVAEDGWVEAHDLSRDPLELAPLDLSPEERAAALERARRWWAEHPPVRALDVEFDERHLERLRGLGYLDG
jgi:arylsulfatase A-like enzyme